nr:uncharacterized protein LOC123770265 [Procambarus clarkii]XP_045617906.1 uncharacterized protein LOC123770265 [Procambarus clarkii]XP_045617907.1 uncharacterized protein LOC123770265 [Procambarus clarkii]
MASSDGLRSCLYGPESLEERLSLGERAFLAPLNVPVSHKEDVVIIWLSQLVTNKVLTLNSADLKAVLRTMNNILNSRRLKALCSNNWFCPISSSFTETLVDIINSSSEDSLREGAIELCHTLLSNPAVAPLVTHSAHHCLSLTKGLINWLIEGHKSDLDVTLTLMASLEVGTHLRIQPDRSSALLSVVDHLLLPHARLNVALKSDEREIVQKLLKEIKLLVFENILHYKLVNQFTTTLSNLFSEETKVSLDTVVEKLLMSIVSAIKTEVEVSQYLLAEFITEFVVRIKNKVLHYQMLIVACHMLDVPWPESKKIPSLEKNSLIGQKLKPSCLAKEKQEALLYSVLSAAESTSIDLTVNVKGMSLKTWLENLGEVLMKTTPETTEGYLCHRTLLKMIPQFMSGLVMKNLWILYCYKKVPHVTRASKVLYAAYDDLLCDVLAVCVSLRNIDNTLRRILSGLREDTASLKNQQIIPDSLLVYEGQLLLPPRFMLSMMKAIADLGHSQVLPVWKTTLHFFTKECALLLKGETDAGALKFVSIVVWLLSCIMKASPVVQVVSVAGVAQNFAGIMKQIALHGIKPLVTAMLTQPHNNDVCGSILVLCHTWGEIHTNLLSIDKGYSELPDLPKIHPPKPSEPTDFSHLLPFISREEWAQISARVANFGNRPTQLALVQLVLQKFSQAALEHHRSFIHLGTVCNQPNQNPTSQALEAMTKYLMNTMGSMGSNVSQLMTVHLAYILPFIHDSHLPVIARYLVKGIKDGELAWQEYVRSEQFHEASRLHPYIFSSICSTLANTSGQRTFSDLEETTATNIMYCIELWKKMKKIGPLLIEFGSDKDENNALWKKLKECGDILKKLVENESTCLNKPIVRSSMDINVMIELIGNFPLSYLSKGLQTAILLMLFVSLIHEDLESKDTNLSPILHIINQTLCSNCQLRIFRVTNASSLLQWLIKKRCDFPFSIITQHMANLTRSLLTKDAKTCYANLPEEQPKSRLTAQALVGQSFDQLLSALLYTLTGAASSADHVKEVARFVISEAASDAELFLQPAVFLMAACYKNIKFCKKTLMFLSTWILRELRKMDLATTAPPTAAAILTAHTIIVLVKTHDSTRKKPHNNSLISESATEIDHETQMEIDEDPPNLEDSCNHEQGKKIHKWQKLLGNTCHLAKLCLSSSHQELQEYALKFLFTVLQHSDVLQAYLPPHLFSTTWTALSGVDSLHMVIDALPHTKLSIDPLLSRASPDDYEKILQDLLKCTQSGTTDLTHTLRLWQVVIFSKVVGVNGALKRVALEHLIPILGNLVTIHGMSDKCVSPHLIPILETLRELINFALKFEAQTIALVLTPCTTIQFHTLPPDQFNQAFTAAVDIVNCILVRYPGVVMERTPSVLATITHLATSLIAQASQECKLEEDQIKVMVGCGTNLEHVVKELTTYKIKLNKIVHFTMAAIVGALQLTTVYPAVKVILESIVYRLLDLCDSHCLNHLLVALPPATTTFLKHLHSNYSTFHRYNPFKA